ncbi:GH25 family lysozyme [Ruminococcus sp. NK3A76]|uniref:GH25 family lysozyme n=1 Tax=Ruminococcus sp. NK3A76 TaxID=877411 RepID=UPI00048AE047|nr:GH25 family lysozyme [Ruminococcus sp. NK3A76]
MKSKYLSVVLALLLTGCGDKISDNPDAVSTVEQTTAAVTEQPVETTTTTTAATTTAVTTKKKPKKPKIEYSYKDTLEVYQKLTVSDWLEDCTVAPDDGDALVPTDSVGTHKLTVSFGGEEKTIKYTVADTTAPVFIYCPDVITVHTGSGFDPNINTGFGDNFDKAPAVSYEGTVDTKTPGDYDIILTLKDSSGNTTTKTATVSVVDTLPQGRTDIPKSDFADFKQAYSSDTADVGIDVSYWQGDIDFKAVKNAGCSFVFVRAAHHSDNIYPDENFQKNLTGAIDAGLDTGVYFYSSCSSPEEAKEHAQWVVDKLAGRELQLPVAFDWESFDRFQRYGMSIHDLNLCYDAFREVIEQNGYKAVLYSSKSFLESFWEEDNSREVWLAHYAEQTDYEGMYTYWQQGLCNISGISGDVDADVRYKE